MRYKARCIVGMGWRYKQVIGSKKSLIDCYRVGTGRTNFIKMTNMLFYFQNMILKANLAKKSNILSLHIT